jgi:hypothetical protein
MTWEPSDTTRASLWFPLGRGQAYCAKMMEFCAINVGSAFEFAQKLSRLTSPTDLAEIVANHTRDQFESLTEQVEELSAFLETTASKDDGEEGGGLGD